MARAASEKREIERLRSLYRESHQTCMRPVLKNGVWKFCGARGIACHEIARRGAGKMVWPNFYSLCERSGTGCHHGWAHREELPDENEGAIALRLFGVKLILGEAYLDDVNMLMLGRKWCEGLDASSPAMAAADFAAEMLGGLKGPVALWNTTACGMKAAATWTELQMKEIQKNDRQG